MRRVLRSRLSYLCDAFVRVSGWLHFVFLDDMSELDLTRYTVFLYCNSRSGKEVEEKFRCGELAMKIYEKFHNSKAWLGRVSAWFYGSVCLWKKPVQIIFEPLKNAHRVALETGDIDFAMLNANIYCWESFDISNLTKVEKIITGFTNRMEVYGHESILMMIKPLWQMIHNFKRQQEAYQH